MIFIRQLFPILLLNFCDSQKFISPGKISQLSHEISRGIRNFQSIEKEQKRNTIYDPDFSDEINWPNINETNGYVIFHYEKESESETNPKNADLIEDPASSSHYSSFTSLNDEQNDHSNKKENQQIINEYENIINKNTYNNDNKFSDGGKNIFNPPQFLTQEATNKILERAIFHEKSSNKDELQSSQTNENYIVCDDVINDEVFYLKSPNYPWNYPSGITCEYVITKNHENVCGIKILILRLDLSTHERIKDFQETSTEKTSCVGDTLSINDETFCGRYKRGTEGVFLFNENKIQVVLNTHGSSIGSSGFLLKGIQIATCEDKKIFTPPIQSSLQCDKIISTDGAFLSSPNYPRQYFNNLDCKYIIKKESLDICALKVTFTDFFLENESCIFDYLEIDGKRFCGAISNGYVNNFEFRTNEIVARFRTDESIIRRGFSIYLSQISCDNFNHITPVAINGKQLWVDKNEKSDSLPIPMFLTGFPNNSDTKEPVGKKFDLISPQEAILQAKNDPNTNDIKNILSLTGRTPNPQNPRYWSNESDLTILFQNLKPSAVESKLKPNTFETNVQPRELDNDLLQLSDASFADVSTNVNEDFNPYITNTISTLEDDDNFQFSTIGFETTPTYDITEVSTYETTVNPTTTSFEIINICNMVIDEENFTITSPNYPEPYPKNLECEYIVEKSNEEVCQLQITIADLDLGKLPGSGCWGDYLDISGTRICSADAGSVWAVNFNETYISLKFKTNDADEYKGFKLQIKQLDGCNANNDYSGSELTSSTSNIVQPILENIDECDILTSERTFNLFSINYPSPYPLNIDCTTTIKKSDISVNRLHLEFIDFDVSYSKDCTEDFLDVSDGHGGERICGLRTGETRVHNFNGESMILTFHSDSNLESNRGFHIRITQQIYPMFVASPPICDETDINSNCNEIISPPNNCFYNTSNQPVSPSFENSPSISEYTPTRSCFITLVAQSATLTSPDYPNDYPNNFNCSYRIVKYKREVCELYVQISHISIETSFGCRNDHLKIGSLDTLCGSRSETKTRVYSFIEDFIDINFKTNSEVGGQGFKIKIQQKECNQFQPANSLQSKTSLPNTDNYEDVYKHETKFRPMFGPPVTTNNQYTRNQDHLTFKIPQKNNYNPFSTFYRPTNTALKPQFHRWWKFRPLIPQYIYHNKNPTINNNNNNNNNYQTNHNNQNQHLFPFPFRQNPTIYPRGREISQGKHLFRDNYPYLNTDYGVPLSTYRPVGNDITSTSQIRFDFTPTPRTDITTTPASSPSTPSTQSTVRFPPTPTPVFLRNFNRQNESVDIFSFSSHGFNEHFLKEDSCNRNIYDSEFEITSPNYPKPYYHGQECIHNIYKLNNTCSVEFDFMAFDLPESPFCESTYFQINNAKYCGRISPQTIYGVPFDNDKVQIKFHSGDFHTGSGYSIKGKQIECQLRDFPFNNQISPDIDNSFGTIKPSSLNILSAKPRNINLTNNRKSNFDEENYQEKYFPGITIRQSKEGTDIFASSNIYNWVGINPRYRKTTGFSPIRNWHKNIG